MRYVATVAMVCVAVTVAAVARVDRTLVRWYDELIGDRMASFGSRPDATARAADASGAREPTTPRSRSSHSFFARHPRSRVVFPDLRLAVADDPLAATGRSRAVLRDALGEPLFSDRDVDYYARGDAEVLRVLSDGPVTIDARVEPRDPAPDAKAAILAPIGADWRHLLERWGPPHHASAGTWYYAGDRSIRGTRVSFEGGRVTGSEPLPPFWTATPQTADVPPPSGPEE